MLKTAMYVFLTIHNCNKDVSNSTNSHCPKHYFEKIRSPVFLLVWDDRFSHVAKGFRKILMEGEEIGLKGILPLFYVFPTGPIEQHLP